MVNQLESSIFMAHPQSKAAMRRKQRLVLWGKISYLIGVIGAIGIAMLLWIDWWSKGPGEIATNVERTVFLVGTFFAGFGCYIGFMCQFQADRACDSILSEADELAMLIGVDEETFYQMPIDDISSTGKTRMVKEAGFVVDLERGAVLLKTLSGFSEHARAVFENALETDSSRHRKRLSDLYDKLRHFELIEDRGGYGWVFNEAKRKAW